MRHIKRLTFWAGLACAAIIVLLVLALDIGLPYRYEIPAGYKGWIVMQFDNPTCSPLERDVLFYVIRIGKKGGMCTSDHRNPKFRYQKFEYVDARGNRTATQSPWGTTAGDSEGYIDMQFIGSQEEMQHYPSPSNRHEWLSALEK